MVAQLYPIVEQFAVPGDRPLSPVYAGVMRILTLLAALVALISSPVVASPGVTETTLDSGTGRTVPITLVAPQGRVRGVIAFSHGALSSPAKYFELTSRWAKAGYFVVAPLHGDSADWTAAKPAQAEQMPWRLADMRLVKAQLPELARRAQVRLGRAPLHAAGHSFGALIAMAWDDPAIVSVIAISPPGPLPGLSMPPETRPMLVVTGTRDSLPMIAPKWQDHLTAYTQAGGPALAYVGTDADHYFGGIFGRLELPGPRAAAAFADLVPLSLQFLRSPRQAARFRPKAGTLEARGF
jgi:dienelactone hydrolase